jgi:hypothetical protein
MSAFLLNNKTIDKILTQLDFKMKHAGSAGREWVKKEFEPNVGVDCSDSDWKTKLGQKMLDLNQLSLGYRYGDLRKELVYKYQPVVSTQIEAFKALQCWLYQCAERNIPETSKLYQFFDNIMVPNWAEFIIMRTPEYDNAEWG